MLTVRLASSEDVGALIALAAAAYRPYMARIGRAPAPVTADYAEQVARGQVWVADGRDGVVGLLVLVAHTDHLLLENVAVNPAVQGQGIGARLLAVAEEHAVALGLTEIRLYTNAAMTENLAYYPRHGYVQTHRAVEHGFDRVYFSKYLAGSR